MEHKIKRIDSRDWTDIKKNWFSHLPQFINSGEIPLEEISSNSELQRVATPCT